MSDPIGSALGAFSNSTIAPVVYDKGVKKNLRWLGDQFQGDNSTYQNALDAFNRSNSRTISDYNALRPQLAADYNNLYQTSTTYNPMMDYNQIRTGNLAALKDWSGQLEGAGSRNDKLALAALGMAGHPDSSYATALRADRVSRNMAVPLGQIFANLGSDTSVIGNQRSNNLGNSVNLLQQRANVPMTGYGLELDPLNALQASRMGQIGQLGATADVAKNNTAGFKQNTDTLGRVSNAMNSFNDSMWQNIGNAMSVYSSLYGGGALGGITGGMGGMGGGGGGGGIHTGSAPVGSNSFSVGNGMNFGSGYSAAPSGTTSGLNAQGYPVMSAPQYQYNPWANYGY